MLVAVDAVVQRAVLRPAEEEMNADEDTNTDDDNNQ